MTNGTYISFDARRLARALEMESLSGEASYEGADGTPLTAGQMARAEALEVVRDLRRLLRHSHDWNEQGYCTVCGADGRA